MKVIVRKGKVRYYVILVAGNGETVMVSEHYFSKGNAERAGSKLATSLNVPIKVLG